MGVDYSSKGYHYLGFINVLTDGQTDYCLPCDRAIDASASVLIFERYPQGGPLMGVTSSDKAAK